MPERIFVSTFRNLHSGSLHVQKHMYIYAFVFNHVILSYQLPLDEFLQVEWIIHVISETLS